MNARTQRGVTECLRPQNASQAWLDYKTRDLRAQTSKSLPPFRHRSTQTERDAEQYLLSVAPLWSPFTPRCGILWPCVSVVVWRVFRISFSFVLILRLPLPLFSLFPFAVIYHLWHHLVCLSGDFVFAPITHVKPASAQPPSTRSCHSWHNRHIRKLIPQWRHRVTIGQWDH